MAKLVNSNRNKRLDRGPDIKPQKTFSIEGAIKESEIKPVVVDYEPKPTTLKIDTRIRDQVNALSLIGYAETQKEVLETAISDILEAMSVDERRKFDIQYQVLEDKTRKINKR